MNIKIENVKLKMVSAEMRPAQKYDKDTKKWLPTGEEEKQFEYVFVSEDEFSEKITLTSKKNWEKLEGKKVTIVLDWKYNNFKKQMGMPNLVEVLPA